MLHYEVGMGEGAVRILILLRGCPLEVRWWPLVEERLDDAASPGEG